MTKQFLVLLLSVFLTANAWAQAGISIFTYGKVSLRSVDGSTAQLAKGLAFNSGDAILTGVNGRAQLRMEDGTIFDLRPNSEFIIDEYHFSKTDSDSAELKPEENKSFYRLMRGGFRTISGLIGKRNKKNYRVTTPVATIGIRGTDYTIDLCEVNCSPLYGKGLYLTVVSGGVVVANDGGSLDVDAGFGAFAADWSIAPMLIGAINSNSENGSIESDNNSELDDNIESDNNTESNNNVLLGDEAPISNTTIIGSGGVAVSLNGSIVQSTANGTSLTIGANNELMGFSTPTTTYDVGTATTINQGFDATTGLYWGRWSGGTATITTASGSTDVNLDTLNAHYMYTPNEITPTIPLTGKANFTLLGNTNPTDNLGNSGVLGLASLSADFTNQTVNTAVNLSINELVWDAIATNVALDGNAASFAGSFDQVIISDSVGTITDGAGSLEGFFTGDAAGDINGAGMAYSLSDNLDTEVDGTVAFEIVP